MTRLERAVQTILSQAHEATPEMAELSAAWRESICYPDRDLSSGLSWDGNVICGDRKSIDAVKLALHEAGNAKIWLAETQRQRQQISQAAEALGFTRR